MRVGSTRSHVVPRTPGRARPVMRMLVIALVLASFASILPAQREALAADQRYTLTNMSSQQFAAQIGTTFGENVGVRVCRTLTFPCQPQNDVAVTFTASTSDEGASGTFVTTGTNTATVMTSTVLLPNAVEPVAGVAMAPAFTANGVVGTYTINAVAAEPDPTKAVPYPFSMNNTLNPATNAFLISAGDGGLQATIINSNFPKQFSAAVVDGNNHLVPNINVTFTAPATGPSGVFTSNNSRVVSVLTDSNGLAIAPPFRANGIEGRYTVVASVSAGQTVLGETITTGFGLRNSLVNVIGVPETISASGGNGQRVPLRGTPPTPLQVTVFDGALAHVSGATVTFTLPSSGASGTFPGGSLVYTTTTGVDGIANAATITTNNVSGQINIQVVATKNDVSASASLVLLNGRAETTTTLEIEPEGGSVYGQPVTLTATVRVENNLFAPQGLVTFRVGFGFLSNCRQLTPVDGVVTCTVPRFFPGTYDLRAEYEGDEFSQESSDQQTYTVAKADTAVALQSSKPQFINQGESVTFTASLSVLPPGSSGDDFVAGTVTFTSSDGTLLNDGNPVSLVGGTARVTTNALTGGALTITANYNGDARYNISSKTLTQVVNAPPVVTQDPVDTLGIVAQPTTLTAVSSGHPVPTVIWQVSTDGGETFNNIPGATSANYTFTPVPADDQNQYRAIFTNNLGSDTSAAAIVTVRQPPTITSADTTTFTVGSAGSFTFTADGILTPTLSMTGELPEGLSYDPESVTISGTPAEGTGGSYPLTVTATNGIEPDAVQNFTLVVAEVPAITSANETTMTVGTLGSFTVTASGFPPATFSVEGALPAGVTLDPSTGILSGTPQPFTSGVYALTITANNGAAQKATQSFTLTVIEAGQTPLTMTEPTEGTYGDVLALNAEGGTGSGAVSFAVTPDSTACEIVADGPDAGKLQITDGTGTCAVTATKAADGTYASVTSDPLTITVQKAVSSLSAQSITDSYGNTITLSATLKRGDAPVGGRTVNFTLHGTSAGTAITDENGVATLADVLLVGANVGTYETGIGASFAEDSALLGSSTSASVTVNMAAGQVSISNLPEKGAMGASLTLKYDKLGDGVVTAVSLTPAICTVTGGTLKFVALGTCELQASIAEGTNHFAATGAVQTLLVDVRLIPTKTVLVSSNNRSVVGQSVTLTAHISPREATGTITFMDGSTVLGSAPIVYGKATLRVTFRTIGSYKLTAVYAGDGKYDASTSDPVWQLVRN